jgi:hypothetical protein
MSEQSERMLRAAMKDQYRDMQTEIERLRGLLAETNAKMMIMHNESISLHARLAEATGIISQRALELADTQGQLTEAKRELARWAKLNPLAQQIADPTLRGIVVSFLDRFGYGASKFDMQAGINRAMASAKKHTPECSYWNGLMAQVCNCGLTDRAAVQPERCCLDYPRCDCNSPPEPDDDWLCFQRPAQPKVTP